MAITHLALDGNLSAQDVTSMTTAVVSPGVNRLQTLAIATSRSSGAGVAPTSITGNGLTWVEILACPFVDGTVYFSAFRAMGASPSTGAIVIDYGDLTQDRIIYTLEEFDGVDTTGANGSGAIGNTASIASAGVSSQGVTLAGVSAGSATYGFCVASRAGGVFTHGSGYTTVGDGDNTHNHPYHMTTEFRLDGQTVIDYTFDSSTLLQLIGLEIKAAAAPPADTFVAAWSMQSPQIVLGRPRMIASGSGPNPRIT